MAAVRLQVNRTARHFAEQAWVAAGWKRPWPAL